MLPGWDMGTLYAPFALLRQYHAGFLAIGPDRL